MNEWVSKLRVLLDATVLEVYLRRQLRRLVTLGRLVRVSHLHDLNICRHHHRFVCKQTNVILKTRVRTTGVNPTRGQHYIIVRKSSSAHD